MQGNNTSGLFSNITIPLRVLEMNCRKKILPNMAMMTMEEVVKKQLFDASEGLTSYPLKVTMFLVYTSMLSSLFTALSSMIFVSCFE